MCVFVCVEWDGGSRDGNRGWTERQTADILLLLWETACTFGVWEKYHAKFLKSERNYLKLGKLDFSGLRIQPVFNSIVAKIKPLNCLAKICTHPRQ